MSKESMLSDLNNLKVVTTTSEKYADSVGYGFDRYDVMLEYKDIGIPLIM